MKHLTRSTLLLGLLLGIGSVHAQDAITIKLKEAGEGTVLITKKTEVTASKVNIDDGNGKILFDKTEVKNEVAEFTETTLKKPAGQRPTLLERSYTKQQSKVADKTLDSSLAGKTVVIELKGDKYAFSFKGGGAIPDADAAPLRKDFGNKDKTSSDIDRVMLPKTAVKVGESWKLDMQAVYDVLFKGAKELDIDPAKSTGVGKLVKAYKKGGRQFGEVEYKLSMPLRSVGEGKGQLKFNAGAVMNMDFRFDSCIDGTSQEAAVTMTMKMIGTASLPDLPGAIATLDVVSTVQGTVVEAAKK